MAEDISRLKTFVANHIVATTKKIPLSHWKHLRSADNPADVSCQLITSSTVLSGGKAPNG